MAQGNLKVQKTVHLLCIGLVDWGLKDGKEINLLAKNLHWAVLEWMCETHEQI
jgi:hypothetical protein